MFQNYINSDFYNKLYLVDLNKGPESLQSIDTKIPIGVTADIEGEDPSKVILVGAKDGVARFHLANQQYDYIVKYWTGEGAEEKTRRMRTNDGNIDSAGRFWVEAFVDPEIEEPTEEGVVFRMSHTGKLERMHSNIEIPNGISWTSDQKVINITDTTAKKLWSYDYNPESGDITNKRVFVDLNDKVPGNPDGHVMDTQGNIWHSLYGGSKVVRISPDGEITGEILLPTRNPTCPVFVGTKLYITTAKEDEPETYPESAEFAGSVFCVDVGVEGVIKYKARLEV